MNRLQKLYQDKVKPEFKKKFKIENDMAVPKLQKVIINMGIGDVSRDKGTREKVRSYISQIAGQSACYRPAKKSIAEFSTRAGDPVGVSVTLRGVRMYEFMDKLIATVLPRVRDFQGVKLNAFDQHGNYNLGLTEQIIFPEVDYDTIDRVRGLQITICTSATNKEQALALLRNMGMPFEKTD